MALSQSCIEQHNKEDAIARRWLCWGLVCASGFHVALIPLLAMRPLPLKDLDELERIELIVTAPDETSTLVDPAAQVEEQAPEPEQPPPPQSEKQEDLEEPEEPEKPEEPEEPEEPEKPEEPEEPEEPET